MKKTYLFFAIALIVISLSGCVKSKGVSNTESTAETAGQALSSTELIPSESTETVSSSAGNEKSPEYTDESEPTAEITVESEITTAEPETIETKQATTTPPPQETTPSIPKGTTEEKPTEPAKETDEPFPQKPIETTQPDPISTPQETAYPKPDQPPQETTKADETIGSAETEPEPQKSVYDSPFVIEQIKAELIALGESMGMTHRIAYKDGTVITPDNSSWELPIVANASFCGDLLKRSLHDYVTSYAEYHLYGGEPITAFTIYVVPVSGGYEFYFLH